MRPQVQEVLQLGGKATEDATLALARYPAATVEALHKHNSRRQQRTPPGPALLDADAAAAWLLQAWCRLTEA